MYSVSIYKKIEILSEILLTEKKTFFIREWWIGMQ